MRVRLKSVYAGPAGCFQPGSEHDFPEQEAKQLVAGGYAESLEQPKESARKKSEPETAEGETGPENTATRTKKTTRKKKINTQTGDGV